MKVSKTVISSDRGSLLDALLVVRSTEFSLFLIVVFSKNPSGPHRSLSRRRRDGQPRAGGVSSPGILPGAVVQVPPGEPVLPALGPLEPVPPG